MSHHFIGINSILIVVSSADVNAKKVEMTLRSGDLSKPVALTLSSLSVGQHLEGSVKKIEEYGLFIQIDNSKLSGLCHKSEVKPRISIILAFIL